MVASQPMQGVVDGGKKPHWAWLLTRLVAVLLAVGSMAVIHVPELPVVGRWVYPYPYRAVIEREAHRRGLDPLLVAAIIRQESGFDPHARSAVGAMGLMQLMPNTARWAAAQLALPGFKVEALYQPETNIVLGTWYLAHLLRQFKDMDKVLAAYNGGEGNVSYWGTLRGEQLAYAHPETQSYVASCRRTYRRYQSLYATPIQPPAWPAVVAAPSLPPSPNPALLPEPALGATAPQSPLPAPSARVPSRPRDLDASLAPRRVVSPSPMPVPLRSQAPSARPSAAPTAKPPRPKPLPPKPTAQPSPTPMPPTARPVSLPRRVVRIPASPSPRPSKAPAQASASPEAGQAPGED